MSAATSKLIEEIEEIQGKLLEMKRRLTEGAPSEVSSLEEKLNRLYKQLAEANDKLANNTNVLKG